MNSLPISRVKPTERLISSWLNSSVLIIRQRSRRDHPTCLPYMGAQLHQIYIYLVGRRRLRLSSVLARPLLDLHPAALTKSHPTPTNHILNYVSTPVNIRSLWRDRLEGYRLRRRPFQENLQRIFTPEGLPLKTLAVEAFRSPFRQSNNLLYPFDFYKLI